MTAATLYSFGQTADSGYKRRKLSKTEIQVVYSHYLQNGNHSAVTGGIGTEKLTVYSPDISYSKQPDSLTRYTINAGVDIISSASTDNIDYVISSASKKDNHGYLNLSYSRRKRNTPTTIGGGVYFSIESDYLSSGLSATIQHRSGDQNKVISAEFEVFFDDLRWGRLSGEHPLKLVYPAELRNREWFSNYRRTSYNVNTSVQLTINKKTSITFFPGISFQHGLLSTPFHRVYFKDSSLKVENLPAKRIRIPLGIQLNRFIADRYFLRSYYRLYWDEWGIVAHTLELKFPVKLFPGLILSPSVRLYNQTASRHFKPYQQHDPSQHFYTSDYDLSSFTSYEPGLELKINNTGKTIPPLLNTLSLRYGYYKRTDGLRANMLTMIMEMMYFTKKK